MKKKKVLILITSNNFIRNYLVTDAFNDIKKKYDCYFLINNNLNFELKKNFFKYLLNRNEEKLFQKFFLIQSFLNHDLSKSTKFIIKKYLDIKIWWKKDSLINNIISFPKRFLAKSFRFLLFLLCVNYFSKFFFKNYGSNLKKNQSLEKIVNQIKPALVIIPTQGQEKAYFDMIKICKENKVESLSLIDNWDNISSRIIPKPISDYFAVWGEQTKIQGIKIQKIKKNKIFILGTPRFEVYKKYKPKKLFKFKYILFCEAFGLTEDISEILNKLEKILDKKPFKEFKLIYRPHPWRKDNEIIDITNYKNILIDPQLKNNYLLRTFNNSFQPSLKYYPKLISNAEFIISSPTTMVIESLLLKKKVIVLGHKSKSIFNHYNHIVKLNHFDGVEKLKDVKICWNLQNLEKMCNDIKLKKIITRKNKKIKLNHFIHYNKLSYSKKLLEITQKII
jgi:hypothetical protein